MAEPGLIVVLNGPSSSGKTSIVRELQRTLPDAWLHVALDAFRAMEPPAYFEGISRELRSQRLEALCRAMNATCVQYARHGQNVLLDHVLPAQGWQWLSEDFAGLPVLRVAVQCSLGELTRRELQRGDRAPGLAASQHASIHEGRSYDCFIDTTDTSAAECAANFARWLADAPTPRTIMAA